MADREKFEAWYRDKYWNFKQGGQDFAPFDAETNSYSHLDVNLAWNAYQAASPQPAPHAMTPADAVYGLLAWLTCREGVVTLGSAHDAAPAAEIAKRFCEANGLNSVSDAYPDNLEFPKKALLAQPAAVEPVTVPKGWKLVPIKPTPEMIDAAADCDRERESVWEAYLAAAPSPAVAEPAQDHIKIDYDHVLLPCAHCGSEDISLCGQKRPDGYSWVQCHSCGMKTQPWDRFDKSVGMWNLRTEPARKAIDAQGVESFGFSPMHLAPLDGTPVMLYLPTTDAKFAVGQFYGNGITIDGMWGDDENNCFTHKPIGWMALHALEELANREASPLPAATLGKAEDAKVDGWSVTVEANGDRILCISDNHVAGLPELDPYESIILGCADHLRAFMGKPLLAQQPAASDVRNAALTAAIKSVRASERAIGRVVIGGDKSELGLSFMVQQLGFAIDNLEQVAQSTPAVQADEGSKQ